MEKKTKLTITLALAVLVITLSLGAAISIAPNETGAQTAAPIQPEIAPSIQQEIAAPIQPEIEKAPPEMVKPPAKSPECCLITHNGRISVSGGAKQHIFGPHIGAPVQLTMTTVTITAGSGNVGETSVTGGAVYRHSVSAGQSWTFMTPGDRDIWVTHRPGPACVGTYTITEKV